MKWLRPADPWLEIDGGQIKKRKGECRSEFYEPGEGLYRNFADLPLDDASALRDFVYRNGFLTIQKFEARDGESLAFWREQVFKLKAIVDLHELTDTPSKLSRVARPRLRDGVFRVLVPFNKSKYWEIFLAPEGASKIRTNADRVRYVITSEIQKAFRKYPTTLSPHWDNDQNRFELIPAHTSLLALIWYQAAASMSEGGPNITQCVVCKDWFPAQRSTRTTCSDRCRQAKKRRSS